MEALVETNKADVATIMNCTKRLKIQGKSLTNKFLAAASGLPVASVTATRTLWLVSVKNRVELAVAMVMRPVAKLT